MKDIIMRGVCTFLIIGVIAGIVFLMPNANADTGKEVKNPVEKRLTDLESKTKEMAQEIVNLHMEMVDCACTK